MTETNTPTPVPLTGPRLSRRTLLARSGLATVALTGLSSCASYGGAETPPASPAGGGGAGAAAAAKVADIPVGGGKIFTELQAVITQPSQGNFKAFSSICTHAQCPVSEVTETTINCSCHGSQFALADGSVVRGPAAAPLPAKTVTVSGDDLVLS